MALIIILLFASKDVSYLNINDKKINRIRIIFRNLQIEKTKLMNIVASILSRKNFPSVTVSPDSPVINALKLMAEKNIGSVIVVEGEKYLGILTERDYSRKVILKGKDSTSTKVADIMSTDLPEVKPGDSVEYCMQLMTTKNIRYMPVFENNKLVGIISMSDVVKDTILTQKETINHLQSYISS
jgi:CBS domain-containing protein